MSRTILISDEVGQELGQEQVARMHGPEWAQRVRCWECDQWIEATDEAAVLIVRVPELDEATAAGLQTAVHAHPGCRSSQVLTLTLAEIDAIRGARQRPDEGGLDAVDVVATTFETRRGGIAPVVLLSYRADLTVAGAGPDRVDLLTTSMLAVGWHPITSASEPPGPGPDGYRVRFRHDRRDPAAPGVLEVLDPLGQVGTEAYVQPTGLWRPAVVRTGRTVLIQGSQYLTDWQTTGQAGVNRAVQAGLLTGGVVPVDLDGPGNVDVPGSVYR
ncbi:hypothetical protein SAMN04488074_13643 [Lentzea albidocapillata subsp. violacea]|uniref:Uncharacterized protein n=1 Tax=Lentzea albidocapillata subsp. violacea TaxID=128104 RepID=A0A1G9Z027_9PSEU|nr:hypothetical protein [Lentzea albidocapillata]SDN14537.1 hypothetical protein SAMN04488074_13643 [Lentzea albidocapillata subsp. violacea]